MSAADDICVWVDGVGLIGPGMTSWTHARALLIGEADYEPSPTVLPAPELLPRRAPPRQQDCQGCAGGGPGGLP
ncbi:hypothetical protein [Ottowia caeni]|uniref:hypothetical protein n=1 Tax=Ottowia caeni TaxID=2870339 RepID=UPI003D72A596